MLTVWERWINEERNEARTLGSIDTIKILAKKYNIPLEEALINAGISKDDLEAYERIKKCQTAASV